jgi:2'-5' RNA ligase
VIKIISDRSTPEDSPKITWVRPAALHVTLRFIGEVDDAGAGWRGSRARHRTVRGRVAWRCASLSPRHPVRRGLVSSRWSALGARSRSRRRLAGTIDPRRGSPLPHLTLGRISTPAPVSIGPVQKSSKWRAVGIDRITSYRSQLSHKGPHYWINSVRSYGPLPPS